MFSQHMLPEYLSRELLRPGLVEKGLKGELYVRLLLMLSLTTTMMITITSPRNFSQQYRALGASMVGCKLPWGTFLSQTKVAEAMG